MVRLKSEVGVEKLLAGRTHSAAKRLDGDEKRVDVLELLRVVYFDHPTALGVVINAEDA